MPLDITALLVRRLCTKRTCFGTSGRTVAPPRVGHSDAISPSIPPRGRVSRISNTWATSICTNTHDIIDGSVIVSWHLLYGNGITATSLGITCSPKILTAINHCPSAAKALCGRGVRHARVDCPDREWTNALKILSNFCLYVLKVNQEASPSCFGLVCLQDLR